jgi:hypothetical protein
MRVNSIKAGAFFAIAAVIGFGMLVALPTQVEAKTKGTVDQYCKNGSRIKTVELKYKKKSSNKAGIARAYKSAGNWYGVKVFKSDSVKRKTGVQVYRYNEKTKKQTLISEDSGTFKSYAGCAMVTIKSGECLYAKTWVYVGSKKYTWNGSVTCP